MRPDGWDCQPSKALPSYVTPIAIFIEGSVWHTTVLPVGGYHITNDVAVGMRGPFDAAEQLKVDYGHARHETIDPTEVVQVKAFGDGGATRIQRRDLAEIIEARAEEIYQLILQEIKRSGYDGLLPAGVVITGGTAQLRGMRELGRQILSLPVRVGVSQDLQGLIDGIDSPAYATSVGLLLWGRDQAGRMPLPIRKEAKGPDLGSLGGFFKKLLPDRNS